MIAKLSGRLEFYGSDNCIVDVGGVGYLVFCSKRTLTNLGAIGSAVVLSIETHVREDHIHLYGFSEAAEQDWFKQLLSVQGVGAKLALAILSTLTPSQLTEAVVNQDKTIMTRTPGVGPKVGSRIVSELKDKIANLDPLPSLEIPGSGAIQGPADDAISALVNLGYRPAEAHRAVQAATTNLSDSVDLQKLIRDSLRLLAS